MDRIDVLLATYNGERFLKPMLDSILAQTHKDIRLIISDDASVDSTPKILKSYAEKDKRIVVFNQEKNLGFVKNFEFLLKQSDAPFVAFADQDDIWHHDKLEKLYSVLKSTGKSLAYSDMRRINGEGEVIAQSWLRAKNFPTVSGTSVKACAVRHFSAGCSQLFTASVRRKMLPFKSCVFAHDWVSIYCAAELMGIVSVPEALSDYRAHDCNVYGASTDYAGNVYKQSGGDKSYSGYVKYRKALIEQNHLRGAHMCRAYSSLGGSVDNSIAYLERCKKAKFFPPLIHEYYFNMAPKECGKRKFYEILYLHLPLVHYIVYRKVLKGRSQ